MRLGADEENTRRASHNFTNCKTIPGEARLTQRRMVQVDLKKMTRIKRKCVKRIKLWELKETNKRQKFEENITIKMEGGEGDWHAPLTGKHTESRRRGVSTNIWKKRERVQRASSVVKGALSGDISP